MALEAAEQDRAQRMRAAAARDGALKRPNRRPDRSTITHDNADAEFERLRREIESGDE